MMKSRFTKRATRWRAAGSTRGFTLIEMVLSLGLMSVVLGIGAFVGSTGRNAFESTSSQSQLDAQVKMALDRVAMEIEMATSDSLDPQLTGLVNDTSQLSMQQVVDIVDGAVVLGDILGVGFVDDPAEAVDGVDNDGDGLIDEGRLVMIRDFGGANQTQVTLCKNVRRYLEGETADAGDENGNGLSGEQGFLILRDGDLLTLQLSIEDVRANGQVTVRSCTTSVMLNN
jgi:prepilin-type N-terminal cleavage/methylation domain-containing protein